MDDCFVDDVFSLPLDELFFLYARISIAARLRMGSAQIHSHTNPLGLDYCIRYERRTIG